MSVLVTHARNQCACIFSQRLKRRHAARIEPRQISLCKRAGRRPHRPKLHDRRAVPGDDDALTLKRAINELGKIVFGIGDAVCAHGGTIATRQPEGQTFCDAPTWPAPQKSPCCRSSSNPALRRWLRPALRSERHLLTRWRCRSLYGRRPACRNPSRDPAIMTIRRWPASTQWMMSWTDKTHPRPGFGELDEGRTMGWRF
jgi:hypothetical protein